MVRPWAAAFVLAACGGGGGGEPVAVPVPVPAVIVADAAVPVADADASIDAAVVGEGLGVTVEWRGVAAALRNSPGRTPCNTPRAAQVAPTTLWGIPEALVIVDGAPAPTGEPPEVVLRACAFAPRVVAAGDALVITSAALEPARVTLTRRGSVTKLDELGGGDALAIQLPIAGHAVRVPLEAGGVYELAAGPDGDSAWVVAGVGAVVTDGSGHATFAKIPDGARAVTAWIPPRGGQPAKRVTKTTGRGDLAIDLATP